jgi:hypothetical protein
MTKPPTQAPFLAIYAENEALIEIETGNVNQGYLPKKALELVNEWRVLRLEELREDWRRAEQELPLLPIPPLE